MTISGTIDELLTRKQEAVHNKDLAEYEKCEILIEELYKEFFLLPPELR